MKKSKLIVCTYYLYLTVFSLSVMADDTEIFFGGSSSSSGVVSPNVLFILDTSSSMTATDGLGVSRLDRMKEALRNILNDSNNINVGLMRFSNPGGPVLYPVSAIDGIIDSNSGEVTSRIASSNADAEQASISAGGAMTLNSSELKLVESGTGGSTSVEVRIIDGNDDAEQRSNGSMYFTSSDLEFMNDGGIQTIGLRFDSLNVPAGATILSAAIEFEIDEVKSGNNDIRMEIAANDVDDAAVFANTSNELSSRVRTTARVDWNNVTPSPAVNQPLLTPDLTSLVQEIVDRPGWNNNNALAFIFRHVSGTGIRTVESYQGDAANAPILRVTYDGGGAATIDNQIIGLHFDSVAIPQGATIDSATIQFAAAAPGSTSTALVIAGEASDNGTTYNPTNFDITGRTYTTSNVSWTSVPAFAAINETHVTPDLSTIVQEIVNRPGWCGGSDLNFMIKGSGLRLARSFESDPSQAPYLRVNYDPDSVPSSPGGCIVQEYSARVKSGSDDAEENSTGGISLTSSDLELVNDGTDQQVGVRFRDLEIEQGTTILSAYVEFTSDEAHSGATSLTIAGHDIDSSQTFTTSTNDISARIKTSSTIAWSSLPAWATLQAKHRTPDISTILQEIVDRPGWDAGNAISLIFTGSGRRTAESYNGSAGEAPRLVYQIQGEGGDGAETTVRSKMIEIVDEIQYKSGTPIVDTLYEGALYYRGGAVDFGAARGGTTTSRREHTRVSHAGSLSAGTIVQPAGCTNENLSALACVNETITDGIYESPMDTSLGSCQQNYIVLLTDGSPSVNQSAAKVRTMTGDSSCVASGNAACGVELAKFLAEEDQVPGGDVQNVTTYTIGFNFSDSFIKDVATAGGGSFFEASTATELTNTFETIIKEILKTDTTFVSPGATVNQFNRLTHRNELYFSLFKPDEDPKWAGNLKKYKIGGSPVTIIDKYSVPAIDASTGFFKANATSFWSPSADGNQVAEGGAGANLPTNINRKIYTWYAASPSTVLSNAANRFDKSNPALTATMLGVDDESAVYRDTLMDWTRGVDVLDIDGDSNTAEDRQQLGDPLHSKPTLVTYGGTSANPDITIFFGTNEGFLHAVDADTGAEVFSFIPEQLLPNLDTFYTNSSASAHPYGMDGSVVTWVHDANDDNAINAADGDHVFLYVGMRRGGRNYYALDVTDRNNPKVLWTITGGQAGSDFEQLGQTWSTPIRTNIKIGGVTEDVLVFSGGYHPNQDDVSVKTPDAYGNAVYIVRAGPDTLAAGGDGDGEPDLLWSAGDGTSFDLDLADMDYSMPASPKVINLNFDDTPDQMYIGDTGGQLWRFDFNNEATTAADFATAGVIGDISGGATTDPRRFYHSPDVALVSHNGQTFLNIAIGSGYQAHPLDEVIEDRFYSFRSTDVYSAPASYSAITESTLYDATENLLGSDGDSLTDAELAAEIAAFEASEGWLLKLENTGEKVLARSLTINNQVIFTTYEPNNTTTTGCTAAIGTARVYAVSIIDATPLADYDADGDVDKGDRSKTLSTPSIAPEPFALIPEDGNPIILIGPETPVGELDFGNLSVRTYWYQRSEPEN